MEVAREDQEDVGQGNQGKKKKQKKGSNAMQKKKVRLGGERKKDGEIV